jgi:riboflavin kinase/FMN adenylyltransferase
VKIITDIKNPVKINNPVITIGTFDGVHVGHRVILDEVVKRALQKGTDSAVVTFNPHPRIVLGQQVSLLNTRSEKRTIIENSGVSHLIEIPFTTQFADLEAEEFIKLLVDLIHPSEIIIGYDHGFGKNRSGDIKQLEESGKRYGFTVVNIDTIELGTEKISSSIIRNLLLKGDVKKASGLLGQYYEISGRVIRGNQIGKRIGYPTANLFIEDANKLIPSMGVYASLAELNGNTYRSMTNIGLRPTINAHQLTIETHILDFNADIYYEKLTIKLIDRIRDEQKFGSLDALIVQLKKDRETTIRILDSK